MDLSAVSKNMPLPNLAFCMRPMVHIVPSHPFLPSVERTVGMGAFTAPLVATQFSHSRRWSLFYLISLGIAIANVAVLIAVFRFKTQDGKIQLKYKWAANMIKLDRGLC